MIGVTTMLQTVGFALKVQHRCTKALDRQYISVPSGQIDREAREVRGARKAETNPRARVYLASGRELVNLADLDGEAD